MDLVEDASFIEKLAQLSYLQGDWIYPQYKQAFVGSDSKYVFLARSLEVKYSCFFFEFFNSV